MIIHLPWPDRELHPNARRHYMTKARAAKKARALAHWAVEDHFRRRFITPKKRLDAIQPLTAGCDVKITFHPPDNRRRDTDGMLSACKAYLDGIADAIGVDDSRFSISISRGEPKIGAGLVIFELRAE